MEVLLRADVDHLGARGDLVKVKLGYGRNYLLPRGMAVQATAANVRQIEQQRKTLLKKVAEDKARAELQARMLGDETIEFTRRAGEHGILFGSVTSMDIAEVLAARGYEIDRKRIVLKDPIKEIGDVEVPVKLHSEVTATLKVIVKREEDQPAAE
ncbi:MAG: 50S ribosomal protein L9 [Blastocatellia bacterium]